MKRLTHKLANGLSTGYWSGRSKADLVERLAEYENTGLTPEEIHIAMRNLEILEERMKEGNDRCLQLGERLGMFDGRKEKPE